MMSITNKPLKITIFVAPGVLAGIVLLSYVLYGFIIIDFDYALSTKENPYGIQALVTYSHPKFSDNIEKSVQQKMENVLWFRYNSEKSFVLMGYYICNGILCIKNLGGESHSPSVPEMVNQPERWAGSTLGNLPWKVGDIVDIKVKVAAVIIQNDGKEERIIPDYDKEMVIDLGESKIT